MAKRQSIAEILNHFLALGDEVAYVGHRGYRSERWSYREVAETAFRFARELERQAIGKGDRVLLWGENSAEWVAAFWGSVLRSAVPVPIDRIASADFALRVLAEVQAKLVVGSSAACNAVAAAGTHPATITLESLRLQLAPHSAEIYPPVEPSRADMAEIIFTSGTTGDPRGVVLTHGNILANLEPMETEIGKYRKYERMVHPIRFLNLLPLSHVFGQFMGIFVPQLIGGTVLFQDSLNPSEILHTIKKERVSVGVTVPHLLETLKNKIERDHQERGRGSWLQAALAASGEEHFVRRWWRFRRIHGLFGWKFWAFISGGAALDSGTEEFWRRLGFVVIQGYGLTESTSLISVNHPFKLGKRSIGKVLPGREIKLDENGEILVRGENIAGAYWQDRRLSPVGGDQGWFRTGDLGELDEQGNLYFKGRSKNVIVTPAGMKVYPADLEAALRRQPEIRDAVVVGISRGGNAEACAVLVPRSRTIDTGEAIRRANQELAEFQRMRWWLNWPGEDLPRTPTQKPRLNTIQRWAEEQLQGAKKPSGHSMMEGGIEELIARIRRTRKEVSSEMPAATPLPENGHSMKLEDDLNLSSLDRVELLAAIEDRFGVDLDESQVSADTTVEQMEKFICEESGPKTEYSYPRWAQSRLVRWARVCTYSLLVWPATMLLAPPKIRGRERLKNFKGPALIVCNHVTYIDIGFIQAALPARLRNHLAVAMQGEMLQGMRVPPRTWHPLRRWFERLRYVLVVALFDVFPLPQKSGFRRSFQYAGESVDRGYSVVVFPEGKRTETGELNPFRSGIGLLAQRLRLPVIPMRLDGLFELKIRNKKFAPAGSIRLTIGTPLQFSADTSVEDIARQLQNAVSAL